MKAILIKGLLIEAVVGIHEYERNMEQPIRINLEMEVDEFPNNHDFNETKFVDYAEIAARIEELIITSKFYLLETMATKIADTLLEKYPISNVSIEIEKPNAITRANSAGVKLIRKA
tara:strand:- start:188 stop:538 length:351 start_codon:yes stop_codon:yes gene_type:complete